MSTFDPDSFVAGVILGGVLIGLYAYYLQR